VHRWQAPPIEVRGNWQEGKAHAIVTVKHKVLGVAASTNGYSENSHARLKAFRGWLPDVHGRNLSESLSNILTATNSRRAFGNPFGYM
jgi:hypothetical protein